MTSPVRSPPIPCWNFVLQRERCNIFNHCQAISGCFLTFHINHSIKSLCFLVTFEKCLPKASPAQSENRNIVQWLNRIMKFLRGFRKCKIYQGSHGGDTAMYQTDSICCKRNFFASTILPKAHVISLPSRIPTQLSPRSQMFVQRLTHAL